MANLKGSIAVLCSLLILTSCDNGSSVAVDDMPDVLTSTSYPIEISGTLDIIDAGVGDSDYAHWALGSIAITNTDYEILVELEQKVLRQAGVDLDFEYGNPVTLWVNRPVDDIYPVSRMRP